MQGSKLARKLQLFVMLGRRYSGLSLRMQEHEGGLYLVN